ncbi:MAG: hypothetical protein WC718_15830 [Phycisphaerales bacterium]
MSEQTDLERDLYFLQWHMPPVGFTLTTERFGGGYQWVGTVDVAPRWRVYADTLPLAVQSLARHLREHGCTV